MSTKIIVNSPARRVGTFTDNKGAQAYRGPKIDSETRRQKDAKSLSTPTEAKLADSPHVTPPRIAKAEGGALTAPTESSSPDVNLSTRTRTLAEFEVDVETDDDGADADIRPIKIGPPDPHTYVRMRLVGKFRCIVKKVPGGSFARKVYFLATDQVARELPADAAVYALYIWVARDGSFGVVLASTTAGDPYTSALRAFARKAVSHWVRFTKDARTDEFSVIAATDDLGPPEFPELGKDEIVGRTFGDRHLTCVNDPIVRGLKGLA